MERSPTTDLRVAKTLEARPALFARAFHTADLKDQALLELNNNPRSSSSAELHSS